MRPTTSMVLGLALTCAIGGSVLAEEAPRVRNSGPRPSLPSPPYKLVNRVPAGERKNVRKARKKAQRDARKRNR